MEVISKVFEAISKVFKNVRKFLFRSVKWGVFGLSSIASAKEDGSHAQSTIFSSSTILFQTNFAGLLKLPHNKKAPAVENTAEADVVD